MAFSSVQFLFVFLPLSLAVYWLCPKWLRNAVLAAFSLLFFAWAGLKGAAILVLLAGINWLGGLSLGRLAHKRPLLILLILLDLAVLGGFKYAGFAAETVNALVPGLLPVLSPALPLGLSFYVFTAIGYCADVAAGKVESEKNPIRFAVFLAFFGAVLHRLAGLLAAVGHHTVAFPAMLGADAGDGGEDMGHHPGIFRGDLGRGGDVLLGDDQEVGGRLRIEIIEGEDLIILVQLVRWDLAGCDLAENTHEGILLSGDLWNWGKTDGRDGGKWLPARSARRQAVVR